MLAGETLAGILARREGPQKPGIRLSGAIDSIRSDLKPGASDAALQPALDGGLRFTFELRKCIGRGRALAARSCRENPTGHKRDEDALADAVAAGGQHANGI